MGRAICPCLPAKRPFHRYTYQPHVTILTSMGTRGAVLNRCYQKSTINIITTNYPHGPPMPKDCGSPPPTAVPLLHLLLSMPMQKPTDTRFS
jgi:hypothetical protein